MGVFAPWVVLGVLAMLAPLADWLATRAAGLPPENDDVPVVYPANEPR